MFLRTQNFESYERCYSPTITNKIRAVCVPAAVARFAKVLRENEDSAQRCKKIDSTVVQVLTTRCPTKRHSQPASDPLIVSLESSIKQKTAAQGSLQQPLIRRVTFAEPLVRRTSDNLLERSNELSMVVVGNTAKDSAVNVLPKGRRRHVIEFLDSNLNG